jgi:hypothetical protein
MLAARDRTSGVRRKLLLTRFASLGASAPTLHRASVVGHEETLSSSDGIDDTLSNPGVIR